MRKNALAWCGSLAALIVLSLVPATAQATEIRINGEPAEKWQEIELNSESIKFEFSPFGRQVDCTAHMTAIVVDSNKLVLTNASFGGYYGPEASLCTDYDYYETDLELPSTWLISFGEEGQATIKAFASNSGEPMPYGYRLNLEPSKPYSSCAYTTASTEPVETTYSSEPSETLLSLPAVEGLDQNEELSPCIKPIYETMSASGVFYLTDPGTEEAIEIVE